MTDLTLGEERTVKAAINLGRECVVQLREAKWKGAVTNAARTAAQFVLVVRRRRRLKPVQPALWPPTIHTPSELLPRGNVI